MDLDLLHIRAKQFHDEYIKEGNDAREKELMALRDDFVNTYDSDYLKSKITKENYCIGVEDHNNFSYAVEQKLKSLGSAKGGASDKFIVYYSKEEGKYKTGRHYSDDINDAFKLVKEGLLKIYSAAKNDKIEDVASAKFWYIIKYKVYWLYNPSKDIPVFKREHVNKIIKKWGITTSKDEAVRRKALYNFKTNDPVFSKMSNIAFMSFLYSPYSGLQLKEEDAERETDPVSKGKDDKPLEQFVGKYVRNSKQNKLVHNNRVIIRKNVDFDTLNQKRRTLGKFGELLVINDETSKLKALGIDKKVEHSSVEVGDGLGYDVTSYDENGNMIYIEVKTTTADRTDGFYLTERERTVAEANQDKYRLYRVYELNKKTGKYKVEIFTYQDLIDKFDLNPTEFVAELKD